LKHTAILARDPDGRKTACFSQFFLRRHPTYHHLDSLHTRYIIANTSGKHGKRQRVNFLKFN